MWMEITGMRKGDEDGDGIGMGMGMGIDNGDWQWEGEQEWEGDGNELLTIFFVLFIPVLFPKSYMCPVSAIVMYNIEKSSLEM